jgi:SpoVK/Ycf46/Vps4 family AAA+-type ATPase
MGAGRIPSRNDPVLLLSLTTNDVSRYFFYDDIEKVVHECVQKTDKEVGKKMEEPCTINGVPVPAPNADDVPSAPEERQAEMPGKE